MHVPGKHTIKLCIKPHPELMYLVAGGHPGNFGNKHAKSCILAVFLRKIVTLSIKSKMIFFYHNGRNKFYIGKEAYTSVHCVHSLLIH